MAAAGAAAASPSATAPAGAGAGDDDVVDVVDVAIGPTSGAHRRAHGRAAPVALRDTATPHGVAAVATLARVCVEAACYVLVDGHGRVLATENVNVSGQLASLAAPTASTDSKSSNSHVSHAPHVVPPGAGLIIPPRSLRLCSTNVAHYHTAHADRAYGCGYRNMQMIFSVLLADPTVARVLAPQIHRHAPLYDATTAPVPSVPVLQELIEAAWRAGFDAAGASQLGHRVRDTRKWIGTTEVACTFLLLGVRIQIHDFHRPVAGWSKLFDLAERYFAAGNRSISHNSSSTTTTTTTTTADVKVPTVESPSRSQPRTPVRRNSTTTTNHNDNDSDNNHISPRSSTTGRDSNSLNGPKRTRDRVSPVMSPIPRKIRVAEHSPASSRRTRRSMGNLLDDSTSTNYNSNSDDIAVDSATATAPSNSSNNDDQDDEDTDTKPDGFVCGMWGNNNNNTSCSCAAAGCNGSLSSTTCSPLDEKVATTNVCGNRDLQHESGVFETNLAPLYFQHNGHSRTIVGIERLVNGARNLLVYDPAKQFSKEFLSYLQCHKPDTNPPTPNATSPVSPVTISTRKSPRRVQQEEVTDTSTTVKPQHEPSLVGINRMLNFFRLDESKIAKHDQYQVLRITGVKPWESHEELEEAKFLTSILETI